MKFPSINKIQENAINHPLTQTVINWTKRNSLPGFFSIPIYNVIVFIYEELKKQDLITRANSMAFSFFLSLFPSILALFTLLPYLQKSLLKFLPNDGEGFYEQMQETITYIMPGNAGDMLFSTIVDVTTNPRVGLFSIGFILAMFFASNGILAMMHGFEKSYPSTFNKRPAWKKRLIAIMITFLLGAMFLASAVLIILGGNMITYILGYVHADSLTTLSIVFLKWIILFSFFYFSISIIYRYGPSTIERFSFFSAGTSLATVLSVLSSLGFSFFVDNFGSYNKLYGTIGTIIVLMLWIQINAFILLVGFELNASIAVNRTIKKLNLISSEKETNSHLKEK